MDEPLTKPLRRAKRLRLYNALKAGYFRNEKKQRRYLKRFGYILDSELTNPRENVVAYNPVDKKLLYISNGTNIFDPSDLKNDGLILSGNILRYSGRIKDEKQLLTKARKKYDNAKLVMAGHSLGGQILHNIAPSSAAVTTYNSAYTPNQKVRENFKHYRTQGDIFSIAAPQQITTTLPSKDFLNYVTNRHSTENIRNEPIFL